MSIPRGPRRSCTTKEEVRSVFRDAFGRTVNTMTPVVIDYVFRNYADGTTLAAEISSDRKVRLIGVTFLAITSDGLILKGDGLHSACYSLTSSGEIWINTRGQSEEAMPGWVQDRLGISIDARRAAELSGFEAGGMG
jgi:hypothetical protein